MPLDSQRPPVTTALVSLRETPRLLAAFVEESGVALEQAGMCPACRQVLAARPVCEACGRTAMRARERLEGQLVPADDEVPDLAALSPLARALLATVSGVLPLLYTIAIALARLSGTAVWFAVPVALAGVWLTGVFVSKRWRWFQGQRRLPTLLDAPFELPAHVPVHRGRVAAEAHSPVASERQLRLDEGGELLARRPPAEAFVVTLADGRDVLVPAGVARVDHGGATDLRILARGTAERGGLPCTLFEIEVRADQPVELVADLEASAPGAVGYRDRPPPSLTTRGPVVLRLLDR